MSSQSDAPRDDHTPLAFDLDELSELPVEVQIRTIVRTQKSNHAALMKRFSRQEKVLFGLFVALLLPAIAALLEAGSLIQRIDQAHQDVRSLQMRVEHLADRYDNRSRP